MGAAAARMAILDAGLDYGDIDQAYVGYVYGNTTWGQTTLYQLGLSGIPIVNLNNACATGSTALYMARQAVGSGAVDVALALGFEQMTPGALTATFDTPPAEDRLADLRKTMLEPGSTAPYAAQMFGAAGLEHQQRYGTQTSTFAQVQVKARRHAANNPMALFSAPLSLGEVLQSPHLYGPLTRYQACPPTCGAAAAIVVSPAFARKRGLTRLVEVAGQALTSDGPATVDQASMTNMVGFDMSTRASSQVYEATGVGPDDVQVVELHDCFTVAEAIFSEALGLCPKGGAEQLILDGDTTYGGKWVVNPSGGLLSKGHPLGATGLAQCYELVQQVRGEADKRQVDNVRHALQHNAGLIGTCVVTLYRAA
jgi:acetyl-CoA acetyltransferase